MKYTPTQYATALYDLIEAEPKQTHDTIKQFARVLLKNQQAGLVRAIATAFEDEWYIKNNVARVEITATEHGLISAKTLREALGKEIELVEKIDQSLGGGIIIQVGDLRIDNTLRNRFAQLKTAISA